MLRIQFAVFQITKELINACTLENDLCQGIQQSEVRDINKASEWGCNAASTVTFSRLGNGRGCRRVDRVLRGEGPAG